MPLFIQDDRPQRPSQPPGAEGPWRRCRAGARGACAAGRLDPRGESQQAGHLLLRAPGHEAHADGAASGGEAAPGGAGSDARAGAGDPGGLKTRRSRVKD